MSEPITLAAIAMMALSGVIGNRSDSFLCDRAGRLWAHLRDGRSEPANHDVLKAVRRSQLLALKLTIKAYDRLPHPSIRNPGGFSYEDISTPLSEWAGKSIAWGEITTVDNPDRLNEVITSVSQVFVVPTPTEGPAGDRHRALRRLAEDWTLDEARRHAPNAVDWDRFAALVRGERPRPLAGADSDETPFVGWWALFKVFFAEEIKRDDRVSRILTQQGVASILELQTELAEDVRQLQSGLEDVVVQLNDALALIRSMAAELAVITKLVSKLDEQSSRAVELLLDRDRARLLRLIERPEQKWDSWQRHVKPIAIVGRGQELASLASFTACPDQFSWQVIYGPHAIGKSRIALEWLKSIRSLETGWILGFAPERPADLQYLARLSPPGPIALVVDDAGSFGEALWEFMYDLLRRWTKHPVRILLIGYSDLWPLPGRPPERKDRIGAAKWRLAESAPAATPDMTSPARGAVTEGSSGATSERLREQIRGIQILPLDETVQRELLAAAVETAGTESPDLDVGDALRGAQGRPAILLLAANHPNDWQDYLRDYAAGLVSRAATHLGADCDDGAKLLALAALAGPIPDEVRARVAPNARPPRRLVEIFGETEHRLSREIPRIEPDLIGQHVAIAAFLTLSFGDRVELASQIAAANPPRFTEQVTALWSQENRFTSSCDFGSDTDSYETSLAELLQLLSEAAAPKRQRYIYSPNSSLTKTLNSALFDILIQTNKTDLVSSRKIIECIVDNSHTDSVLRLFQFILDDNDFDESNRVYWHSLLHGYVLRDFTISNRHPDNPVDCSGLLASLTSDLPMGRIHAAFEISEWARDNPANPRQVAFDFDAIADALIAMISSSRLSEQISAAFALKWLASDVTGRPGEDRIRPQDWDAVTVKLGEAQAPPELSLQLLQTLSSARQLSFRLKDITAWLPVETRSMPSN
ncbi:ATP-binding protein [Methylopila sp. M107]|uniref:ATP-binding protein n=1 Tax=Methylopila sp. M107 TaxID=1101190 RepID=UPI00037B72B6|nr:ATP-binding protein [Methylopila sp. M107]